MAETITPDPQEAEYVEDVDHEVTLNQLAVALGLSLLGFVNARTPDLYGGVADRLARVRGAGALLSATDQRRVRSLERFVSDWVDGTFGESKRRLRRELERLVRFEANFQIDRWSERLGVALNKPDRDALMRALKSGAFLGRDFDSHWDNLARSTKDRIITTMRQAISDGATVEQALERLRGSELARGADGTMGTVRRHVRAVTSTARVHATTAATSLVAEANPETFDRHQWIAVLDHRTCATCRARAGMVWAMDQPHPMPPAHYRCRCSLSLLPIGQRPQREMTFDGFLSKLSPARQDEILGKQRAGRWRQGQSVRQFVEPDGAPLTLDQIRRRMDREG